MSVIYYRLSLGEQSDLHQTILPNDGRLLVSDYHTIAERSATRLRFSRPLADGSGYQHCAPGARVSFITNASSVRFRVAYNGLVTRTGSGRNFVSVVLVDGALHSSFTNPLGEAGAAVVDHVVELSSLPRQYDLVWPYGDGMDLLAIILNAGASLFQGIRPLGKMVVAGDSMTQGFEATDVLASYALSLPAAKARQLINMGYGGRRCFASDAGEALTGTGADRVVYLIGFNDFFGQVSLATFQSEAQGWITAARAALPSAKIYIVSPLYSPATAAIPLSSYRSALQAAEGGVGDAETFFIDGLSLMANDLSSLAPDQIHPNNFGMSQVWMNLAAQIAS
jgi:lysophospholipase L1-like esterase